MNRYRIFWNVAESWVAEVDAVSESAARQAFIDHEGLENVHRYNRNEIVDSIEMIRVIDPSVAGWKVGDRVRLTAPMVNSDSSVLPVEDLPIGAEGTVDWVGDLDQLGVKWDNGRRLMLIPSQDSFEKIGGV